MSFGLRRLSVSVAFASLFVFIGTTTARAGDDPSPTCDASDADYPADDVFAGIKNVSAFPGGAKAVTAANEFAKAAKDCTKNTKTAQMACTEGCSSALAASVIAETTASQTNQALCPLSQSNIG